jgi:2-keto-4-pentenoate hydratase
MNKTLEAAKTIAVARRNRTPLQPLSPAIAPRDEAEGYRIQDAVHGLLVADVGALVGYKIGCTSAVMQRYLGIPHPCCGGVFANGVHQSGVSLSHRDFVRVGVECEIAVRLARDLVASGSAFTTETVAGAIDAYHPAIEIVDDRYADWQTIGAPTPVARAAAPDLLDVIGRATINGVEIGRGSGADVLGHPHAALAWLANHLAASGRHLRAGQIVLTGSLVRTAWLNAGDKAVMELSGLGTVAAKV